MKHTLHFKSFLLGATFSLIGMISTAALADWNLGGVLDAAKIIGKNVSSLVQIKQNLDADVAGLKSDAKNLMGDKENLMAIKEQLSGLANKTREQIDSINKLVGVVEGHLKSTQTNITKTAEHVSGIDEVRKDLSQIKK